MNPISSLKPFDFAQAVARAGLGVDGQPLSARKAASAPEGGFATAMTQALKSVSSQQMDAQRLQRELQLDNPAVSLEQTMVSMQKAQIGFQAALAVRNQFVRAYTDIMNMQV
jgi:flagellar hook-basal body complex protein FliE